MARTEKDLGKITDSDSFIIKNYITEKSVLKRFIIQDSTTEPITIGYYLKCTEDLQNIDGYDAIGIINIKCIDDSVAVNIIERNKCAISSSLDAENNKVNIFVFSFDSGSRARYEHFISYDILYKKKVSNE